MFAVLVGSDSRGTRLYCLFARFSAIQFRVMAPTPYVNRRSEAEPDLVVSKWAADWSVRPPRRALFKVLVTLSTRAYHMPRGFAYRRGRSVP